MGLGLGKLNKFNPHGTAKMNKGLKEEFSPLSIFAPLFWENSIFAKNHNHRGTTPPLPPLYKGPTHIKMKKKKNPAKKVGFAPTPKKQFFS